MRKKKIIMSWFRSPLFAIMAAVIIVLLIILIITTVRKGESSGEETSTVEIEISSSAEDGADNADSVIPDEAKTEITDPEAGEEQTVQQETEQPAAAAGVYAPENEDGSGKAGVAEFGMPMEPGWHSDDYSIWYCPANDLCYYNGWQEIDGSMYHFNSGLRADRGWVLIGGTGCYFDDNGVYDPNADNSRLLAFTFDDGPSQGTDMLLELCEQTGARITFFMIGVQVENGGAVIPHIMWDRCELGNHSYTHSLMLDKTTEDCVADFALCDEWIRSFSGGAESTLVRFPYGDYYSEQTAAVGKPNIFWDIDSLDWDLQDKDAIINQVMPQISEGDIILMHCRFDSTVEACREMFPELIAQGYQLVTVSELAAAKGIDLQGGYTYFGFCDEYIEAGTAFSQ